MTDHLEQEAPIIQIRAEWHTDQSCWIATNALTGEDIAKAGTLAEIEFQLSLLAHQGDGSAFHFMPLHSQGRFLVH